MDLTTLSQQWGIWAFIGYFAYRELWPWVRDKVFPQVVAEHEAAQQADRELRERVLNAFERNTVALTDLKASMEQQTSAMTEIKEQLRHLVEDVIEVRVKLNMPGSRRNMSQ